MIPLNQPLATAGLGCITGRIHARWAWPGDGHVRITPDLSDLPGDATTAASTEQQGKATQIWPNVVINAGSHQ